MRGIPSDQIFFCVPLVSSSPFRDNNSCATTTHRIVVQLSAVEVGPSCAIKVTVRTRTRRVHNPSPQSITQYRYLIYATREDRTIYTLHCVIQKKANREQKLNEGKQSKEGKRK